MPYEYYQNSIEGEWADYVSVYQAILEEQSIINEMAKLMGRSPLFRKDFTQSRPREFALLLRPTRRNFEAFVHVLDKMLSDNMDISFFKGEIPLEETTVDGNGNQQTQRLGSIVVLDRFLRKRFRLTDESVYDEIIEPLREVRKLRQKPAHRVSEDEFDLRYVVLQDDLVKKVYASLRYLRMALGFHPLARDAKVPDWLDEGRIKVF
jgi:hypothetical protein